MKSSDEFIESPSFFLNSEYLWTRKKKHGNKKKKQKQIAFVLSVIRIDLNKSLLDPKMYKTQQQQQKYCMLGMHWKQITHIDGLFSYWKL